MEKDLIFGYMIAWIAGIMMGAVGVYFDSYTPIIGYFIGGGAFMLFN